MAQTSQYKLTIQVHSVVDPTAATANRDGRGKEATLALARLIGRQMAREQFARDGAAEGKVSATPHRK